MSTYLIWHVLLTIYYCDMWNRGLGTKFKGPQNLLFVFVAYNVFVEKGPMSTQKAIFIHSFLMKRKSMLYEHCHEAFSFLSFFLFFYLFGSLFVFIHKRMAKRRAERKTSLTLCPWTCEMLLFCFWPNICYCPLYESLDNTHISKAIATGYG